MRPVGRRARLRVALACVALLLLASCAAPIVVPSSLDPLALLAPGELAYLRMNGDTARLLVPSLLGPGEGKALAPLLDRTNGLGLGLSLDEGGGASSFDAAFLGSYPFRSAGMALGASRGWKREGRGFVNASEGVRVSIPGPDLVLATSAALEPLLERAKHPGASPLPPRLAPLANRALLLWIPEPFSGLAKALTGASMDVPAVGLALYAERVDSAKATPAKAAPATYALSAVFVMRDAEAARVYRPLLRLAWYGIARALFAEEAETLLSARFTLEEDLYSSSAVELPASALASALGRLGGFPRPEAAGRD